MNQTDIPEDTAQTADDEGVGGAIRALIEDGQTLVEAEIAYRKAQAAYGFGEAKTIAVMLLLGLAFGFFTLLALVVGLLLALSRYFGVWGALGIVGGVLALLTAFCLMRGLARINAVTAALGGPSEGGPSEK